MYSGPCVGHLRQSGHQTTALQENRCPASEALSSSVRRKHMLIKIGIQFEIYRGHCTITKSTTDMQSKTKYHFQISTVKWIRKLKKKCYHGNYFLHGKACGKIMATTYFHKREWNFLSISTWVIFKIFNQQFGCIAAFALCFTNQMKSKDEVSQLFTMLHSMQMLPPRPPF